MLCPSLAPSAPTEDDVSDQDFGAGFLPNINRRYGDRGRTSLATGPCQAPPPCSTDQLTNHRRSLRLPLKITFTFQLHQLVSAESCMNNDKMDDVGRDHVLRVDESSIEHLCASVTLN